MVEGAAALWCVLPRWDQCQQAAVLAFREK